MMLIISVQMVLPAKMEVQQEVKGALFAVSSYKDFKATVQSKDAKIVIVQGTIKTTDGEGYGLKIESNKTIMGKDKKSTIYGGLSLSGVKNVILYNINIQGSYPNSGPGDCIDISNGSTNIWVHHVTVWDADDGNIDIKGKANYITVSYCKFYYSNSKNPHRFNGLIGSGVLIILKILDILKLLIIIVGLEI